jgi:hypothetical protein
LLCLPPDKGDWNGKSINPIGSGFPLSTWGAREIKDGQMKLLPPDDSITRGSVPTNPQSRYTECYRDIGIVHLRGVVLHRPVYKEQIGSRGVDSQIALHRDNCVTGSVYPATQRQATTNRRSAK